MAGLGKPVVAMMLCDFKPKMWNIGPPSILALDGDYMLYFGVSTSNPKRWQPLERLLKQSRRPYQIDYRVIQSTWYNGPRFAQDQRRLVDICIGRNLARDYALLHGASHIFFVDDDTLPPKDALVKLLEPDKPLISGIVPGRGAHSHLRYVFGSIQVEGPNLISADHIGFGLTLIRRDLLGQAGIDWQVLPDGTVLSEDIAYAKKARDLGYGRWYARTDVVAQHVDDPDHPLTADAGAVNVIDYIQYR